MLFKDLFKNKNDQAVLAEMNTLAVPYMNKILEEGIDDMEETKYFLLILDRLYQNGYISPLRDNEYDGVLELYLDNGGEMIRGDMSSGDKAEHVYPNLKGTIKKVHHITEADRLLHSKVKNHKSLETWLKSVIDELNGRYKTDKINLGFYSKFDGLSVILEIEDGRVKSAITRGDKELGVGQDKSHLFRAFDYSEECRQLGVRKFGLKCEALVSKEAFKEYNRIFGNNSLIDPRSAATAILNSDNPSVEELKYLTLMPLMIMVDGFEYPIPNQTLEVFDWVDEIAITSRYEFDITKFDNSIKLCEEVVKCMAIMIKECEYPCDGIVIRIEDAVIKSLLGRNEEDCINNFERAYKFPPATAKTVIESIQQEIGLLGKVSFTAKVKPVKINNKTIKSISLGSGARFDELKLAPYDEVLIQYDIVPYLTLDNTCQRSNLPVIPKITHCPDCGAELVEDPELSCVNENCPSRVIGKIYNYCAKMNIEGIGEETIATLYHQGLVSKISDIYTLKDKTHLLKAIDRFGDKSIKNLLKSIDKINTASPDLFLGSLGIPSCGRRVFLKVLEKVPYEDLILGKGLLDIEIAGIGEKTKYKILEGLENNYDEIKEISKYITIKIPTKAKLLVCFTKVRNRKFEEYLAKQNIASTDTLTKNVDLLITGSSTSSKVEKAIKWGIPVMNISDAYVNFGYVEE